jgi:hypothetical protein
MRFCFQQDEGMRKDMLAVYLIGDGHLNEVKWLRLALSREAGGGG